MKSLRSLTAILLTLAAAFSAAEVDRSTPEATVKSLVSALERRSLDDALSCIKDSVKSGTATTVFAQLKDVKMTIQATVTNVTITDTKATAKVEAAINGTDRNGKYEMKASEDVAFEKVGDSWLLVCQTKENPKQSFVNTLAYLLTSPPQLTGGTHVGNPDAKTPQKGFDQDADACLINVKQLGLGFIMLAADNDDIIKVKKDAWLKSVRPYLKNPKALTCPLDKIGTVSYSINPLVAGVSMVKIKEPWQTVLLYEGSKGKLNFRHRGMAAVVYCDGHAKMINAEQAKKLIWKP